MITRKRWNMSRRLQNQTQSGHDPEEPSPAAPCSPLPLADCDCDPDDDPSPMETYRCAECEEDVAVCLGCYQIRNGCDCGHCEDGATFIEE